MNAAEDGLSLHAPGATSSHVSYAQLEARIRARRSFNQPVGSELRQTSPRAVLGVTTWNRKKYLRRFLASFLETRSDYFDWTVVVADDGSHDGSQEVVEQFAQESQLDVLLLQNFAATITGQTNSILLASMALGFDIGFKCDDDVFFTQAGWDRLYLSAVSDTGFDHLVYHNREWKPAEHEVRRVNLISHVPARSSMGCFWTFTPRLIERIGYFDGQEFAYRGHAHLDYTVRACRVGFNDERSLFDAHGSQDFIGMWSRDQYDDLVDWSSPEVKRILSAEEKERRWRIIDDQKRTYVPYGVPENDRWRRSVVVRGPRQAAIERRLLQFGCFELASSLESSIPHGFILNLPFDEVRWAVTAAHLANLGLTFERFPGVNGNTPEHIGAWRAYEATGLSLPLERKIGRKLIQSPGAWGYLLTMEKLLEHAKQRRLPRVLVFDDDVRPHDQAVSLLQSVTEELPSGWKLVYLGATQRQWSGSRQYSEHLYRPGHAPDGSYAVAIDASIYDHLLEEIRRMDSPFDAGPLASILKRFPRDVFVATPSVFIPDVSTSAIREPRQLEKLAQAARWQVDAYRPRSFVTTGTNGFRNLRGEDLVSVAVTVDGAVPQPLLPDVVEALRHQTHGKFELLVALRSATSELLNLIHSAAAKDSRLRVFQAHEIDEVEMNNLLLRESRGEIFTVIRAEHVADSKFLEVLISPLLGLGAIRAASTVLSLESSAPPSQRDLRRFVRTELPSPEGTQARRVLAATRHAWDVVGGLRFPPPEGLQDIEHRLATAGVPIDHQNQFLLVGPRCRANLTEPPQPQRTRVLDPTVGRYPYVDVQRGPDHRPSPLIRIR